MMLSFVGCTGSVKGTYKGYDRDAIIIEGDTVKLVYFSRIEYFSWKKRGDYIYLTPQKGDHTFEEYRLEIVDGGVVYHYTDIENDDEYHCFYEKIK
jgi:hypothetical protein